MAAVDPAPPLPPSVFLEPDEQLPDLDGLLRDAADESKPPWQITGRGSAEWAMGMLAFASKRLAGTRTQYAAWRARLKETEQTETAADAATVEFFEGHLARTALARRAETDQATWTLNNGKVTTVAVPPALEIVDPAALIAWLDANCTPEVVGRIVETKRTVGVRDLAPVVAVTPLPARVLLSCGHEAEVGDGLPLADSGEIVRAVEVGQGVVCPAYDGPVLVAKILDTVHVPLDARGRTPDGVRVRPGYVSPTVRPGGV